MNSEQEPLDYFNPGFVMALILAVMGDLASVLGTGMLIPGVGFVFLFIFFLIHYAVGIIVGFMIISQLHHLTPKLVVLSGIIIPLPTLTLSILLALPMQNKIIESAVFLVGSALAGPEVEAAAKALQTGAATAEAGEAAEVAATGRALVAGNRVVRGEEEVAEFTKNIESGTVEGAPSRESLPKTRRNNIDELQKLADTYDQNEDEHFVSPEDLGEEPFFFDKLVKDSFQTPTQTPESANDNDEDAEKNVTIRDDDTIDLAS